MNPCDTVDEKLRYELTDMEKRERDENARLAIIKLESMEHHRPPRKGEYCYFNTAVRRDLFRFEIDEPNVFICKTNNHTSVGVHFSVLKPVDTYYTRYCYQGVLEKIITSNVSRNSNPNEE